MPFPVDKGNTLLFFKYLPGFDSCARVCMELYLQNEQLFIFKESCG